MRIAIASLFTAASLGAILMAGTTHARADEPKVGDKAPDFEMVGSDGETYQLSQFLDEKPVVLAWFPKAFTGGCTQECKSFRATSDALKGTGVAYFTASVDDAETNAKFAKSLDLDYPILSDPSKEVAEAYGVVHEGREVPERWTFYIDKDGVIRAIDKEVSGRTESAGEDVVAKLKELKMGE